MPIALPWCSGASDGWGLLPERGLNVEMDHRLSVGVGAGRVRHYNIWSLNYKRQKDKIDISTLIILSVDLPILNCLTIFGFLQFYQLDKRAIFLHL